MSAYEHINNQPSRLGEFQLAKGERAFGEFGELGDTDATIKAVGSIITSVVISVNQSATLRQQSRDRRKMAIQLSADSARKLGFQIKGATEQAAIEVEEVKAKYGSITKLILGVGGALAGLMLAGAFAYKLTQ